MCSSDLTDYRLSSDEGAPQFHRAVHAVDQPAGARPAAHPGMSAVWGWEGVSVLSAPVPAASWVPSTVLVGAAWRRGKSVSQEPGLGRAGARRQVWRVWLKTREQDPCSPVTLAEVDGGRGQVRGGFLPVVCRPLSWQPGGKSTHRPYGEKAETCGLKVSCSQVTLTFLPKPG